MAFRAKDLTYDSNEPAFLRRLKGHARDEESRRPNPSAVRPERPRLTNQDDEPTYVLEGSNDAVSEDYLALVTGLKDRDGQPSEKPDGAPVPAENEGSADAPAKARPQGSNGEKALMSEAGVGGKKRKVAKAVGVTPDEEDGEKLPGPTRHKRPKKKAKPIKLSFDDGEDP